MPDAAILRILDVNFNRAREALRVAEEYARFVLEDAAAAGDVKRLRHTVRAVAAELRLPLALAERDIEHDVGRDLRADAERTRADAADVARAALARFGEAARALAEYGKVLSPAFGQAAERLRHEGYRIESLLLARGDRRRRFARVRLYVLISGAEGADWQGLARAALAGGAEALQLREKGLCDRELVARARTLRALTSAQDALLLINDRPDVARLCDADGVHIGQDDLSVNDARRVLGQGRLVGLSTHTPEQFEAARRADPDYLAVGPIFASSTKPNPDRVGVEGLRALAAATALPVVAIGGISADHAAEVFAAGARCVCVGAAISAADDPEQAAAAIRACAPGAG